MLTVAVIKPLIAYRSSVNDVQLTLSYFSHILTSPGSNEKLQSEAHIAIRKVAMQLEGRYLGLQFSWLFKALGQIPDKTQMIKVKRSLVFLSNSVGRSSMGDKNHIELANVFRILKIKELDEANGIEVSAKIIQSSKDSK